MEITYCSACGNMVPPGTDPEDLPQVDGEPFCARCYKKYVTEHGEPEPAPAEEEPEWEYEEELDAPDLPPQAAPPPEPETPDLPEELLSDGPDIPDQFLSAAARPLEDGEADKKPLMIALGLTGLLGFIILVVIGYVVLGMFRSGKKKDPPAPGRTSPPVVKRPKPAKPPKDPVKVAKRPKPKAPPPRTSPKNPKPRPKPQRKRKTALVIVTADTYVRSGDYAGRNYGKAKGMAVRGSKELPRRAYLKFDLGAYRKKKVLYARLRLTAIKKMAAAKHFVNFVANDDWQETKVIWQNKPKPGEKIGTLTPLLNKPSELDITAAMQREAAGDGWISLCISAPTGNPPVRNVIYASKEHIGRRLRPTLVIIYE